LLHQRGFGLVDILSQLFCKALGDLSEHRTLGIDVARGDKGATPSKFLEHMVILCFERHFSKQNSVIRLKSHISPQFLGWLRYCPWVENSRFDHGYIVAVCITGGYNRRAAKKAGGHRLCIFKL